MLSHIRVTVWYGEKNGWCFMYRPEDTKEEPKISDLKYRQKVDLGLVTEKSHKKGKSTGSIASPMRADHGSRSGRSVGGKRASLTRGLSERVDHRIIAQNREH